MKSERTFRQACLRYSLAAILIVSLALNTKLLDLKSSAASNGAATPGKIMDKAIKAEIERKEFEIAQLRSTVFLLFKPVIQTLNITFLDFASLNCFVKSSGPVLVVESRFEHTAIRSMIRERMQIKKNGGGAGGTKASSKKDRGSLRIVFFIGRVLDAAAEIEESIKRETSAHRDVIQGNYDDADTGTKTLAMLKWLQEYCWRYHFIVHLNEEAMVPAGRWTNDVFTMLTAMKLASEEFDHFVMAGAARQKLGSRAETVNRVVGYTRNTVPILLQAGIRLDEPHESTIGHVESYSSALNIPFILDGSFRTHDAGGNGRGFFFT